MGHHMRQAPPLTDGQAAGHFHQAFDEAELLLLRMADSQVSTVHVDLPSHLLGTTYFYLVIKNIIQEAMGILPLSRKSQKGKSMYFCSQSNKQKFSYNRHFFCLEKSYISTTFSGYSPFPNTSPWPISLATKICHRLLVLRYQWQGKLITTATTDEISHHHLATKLPSEVQSIKHMFISTLTNTSEIMNFS